MNGCEISEFDGSVDEGKGLIGCHAMSTGASSLARNAESCRPEVLDRFTDKSVAVFQSTRSNFSEDLNIRC